MMRLELRSTGLGSPIDKDRRDYAVFSGGWEMGRIYEIRGLPTALSWFWSLHGILGALTLEAAKAEFEETWRQWPR